MSGPSKQGMGVAVELMRRGGTLLKEACPSCGSVQVRFKGKALCVKCEDLSELIKAGAASPSDALAGLRGLVVGKIKQATGLLSSESDVERQGQIVTLLLKYIELLDKVERFSHDVK